MGNCLVCCILAIYLSEICQIVSFTFDLEFTAAGYRKSLEFLACSLCYVPYIGSLTRKCHYCSLFGLHVCVLHAYVFICKLMIVLRVLLVCPYMYHFYGLRPICQSSDPLDTSSIAWLIYMITLNMSVSLIFYVRTHFPSRNVPVICVKTLENRHYLISWEENGRSFP